VRSRKFEIRASFSDLDEGLGLLHRSVDRLRRALGRHEDDRDLMLFETALGEIGSNVLTHGRLAGNRASVDFVLRLEDGAVVAQLSDHGAPAHEHLSRELPGADREDGRGIAIARSLLDELGYERDGDLNRWRLVKRL
jgi:serine/threonine-protein kinase RsbW